MRSVICAVAVVLFVSVGFAEDPKEELSGFDWLKRFEGSWSISPSGSVESRAVGERWVVNDMEVFGIKAVQTIGYDEKRKHFLGTWIDSTSSFLWRYTGRLDPTGTVLVLEAEGPDMMEPTKTRKYRDTYQFTSENEITAVSKMLTDDGEWKSFHTSTMTRKSD